MTPDDFFKQNFKSMEFELNPGRLELTKIRLAIENKWYSLSIMKSQIRILEYLKSGNIDEDKITELMTDRLNTLDKEIQTELTEHIAFISSKSNR
jgi:hypothetical protein